MSHAATGAITMRTAIRRLSLGIVLILLVSGILLVSDWNRGSTAKRQVPRIALFKFQSQPLVDEGVGGIIEGLKARGFIQGRTIRIEEFNAQNDFPTANSIGRTIAEGVMTSRSQSPRPACRPWLPRTVQGR